MIQKIFNFYKKLFKWSLNKETGPEDSKLFWQTMVFMLPLGLYALWRKMNFSKSQKIAITVVIILIPAISSISSELTSQVNSLSYKADIVSTKPAPQKVSKLPDISIAKPYIVKSIESTSTATRRSSTIYIFAPLAKTAEARAATVMSAALSKIADQHAIQVILEMSQDPETTGQGYNYALANYSPSGYGFQSPAIADRKPSFRWEISSSDYKATDLTIKVINEQCLLSNTNYAADSWSHKKRLGYIANRLGVSYQSVEKSFPLFTPDSFYKQDGYGKVTLNKFIKQ